MGLIAETVQRFFRDDDWKFEQVDENILKMGVSGKNGRWTSYAQVREEQDQFVFYSVAPTTVPEASRAAVAEFLTRANYGMVIGNFEMDYRDGEVRFKTSIDLEGDCISPALVRNVVYVNVRMMDRYLKGLMGVAYAGLSPEQAVKEAEG
jgi:hypothetical protein